jgi:hypothetical protein
VRCGSVTDEPEIRSRDLECGAVAGAAARRMMSKASSGVNIRKHCSSGVAIIYVQIYSRAVIALHP